MLPVCILVAGAMGTGLEILVEITLPDPTVRMLPVIITQSQSRMQLLNSQGIKVLGLQIN